MLMLARLLLALAALAVACQACTDALCDHGDMGSCGTACCKLTFDLPQTPTTAVMTTLNATMHASGPDGLYTAQPTAEGTSGFADLRPYDKPVDFIGQAFHLTKNGEYTDTINFTIAPTQGGSGSRIFGFSLSQIGGAYGDDGQNYYNIVAIVQAAFPGAVAVNVDASCPPASSK